MVFMIAAYAVIWALTFLFILSIFARQRHLQRDLELMQQLLEEQRPSSSQLR